MTRQKAGKHSDYIERIKNQRMYQCGDEFTASDAASALQITTSTAITLMREMLQEGYVSRFEYNNYDGAGGICVKWRKRLTADALRKPWRKHTNEELGIR